MSSPTLTPLWDLPLYPCIVCQPCGLVWGVHRSAAEYEASKRDKEQHDRDHHDGKSVSV